MFVGERDSEKSYTDVESFISVIDVVFPISKYIFIS